MFFAYLTVLNPVFGLLVNSLAQVTIKRLFSKISLLSSKIFGFASGLAALILFQVYLYSLNPPNDKFPVLLLNLLIYALLGQCYSEFVGIGETSIRIRVLREILEAEGGLSMEEILNRYNAREIVDVRLARLVRGGQVIYKNGRYYSKVSVVTAIAKALVIMKRIIYGNKNTGKTEVIVRESATDQ